MYSRLFAEIYKQLVNSGIKIGLIHEVLYSEELKPIMYSFEARLELVEFTNRYVGNLQNYLNEFIVTEAILDPYNLV